MLVVRVQVALRVVGELVNAFEEEVDELEQARRDVDRLLWAQSVSPEAEVRRLESLARARRELLRLERIEAGA